MRDRESERLRRDTTIRGTALRHWRVHRARTAARVTVHKLDMPSGGFFRAATLSVLVTGIPIAAIITAAVFS